MGYRSDVAYTIRFNAATKDDILETVENSFKLFLAEAKSKSECAIAMNEVTIDEGKMQLNFYCQSTKWYDSYEDVHSHEELVSLARDWVDDCKFIGVVFVRVGEELEDNVWESDGNYDWDWLNISRSVVPDWA